MLNNSNLCNESVVENAGVIKKNRGTYILDLVEVAHRI